MSKFFGTIKDGKVNFDHPSIVEDALKNFPDGVRVEISITKEKHDPTLQQYAYYQACIVTPLSEYLGYNKEEVDGILCREFLTVNKGTEREYVKSKSQLRREELAEFIDNAIMFAAEFGVVVPPPNPNWRLKKSKPQS